MNISIDYKFFEKELNYIKDIDIRLFTKQVLKFVDGHFFTEAASSTGKYHPEYSLGFAGLYRHSQAATKIAYDLLQLDMYKEKFSESIQDYIIASLILHDTCKRGVDWTNKYTVHEHPLLVEKLLLKVFDYQLNDKNAFADKTQEEKDKYIQKINEYIWTVSNLVKSHMGQWTTTRYSKIELPKPELDSQKFVHMCDYLASRKWLEVKLNQDDN